MSTLAETRPEINYLVKDYASFRRLLLDRLALLLPGGVEDQPADLQIALVELLAYTADHLSYSQDAVATEAYLGTARSRVSLRRHARLLGYRVHEGCNARAWIYCETKGQTPVTVDNNWRFLTDGSEPVIFEPCHKPVLYSDNNEIEFSATEAGLASGAREAQLKQPFELKKGDLLLLEGQTQNGPLLHHVVRLTEVKQDDVVYWGSEDALPFDLPLAVAHGNIVLADHGQTKVVGPDNAERSGLLGTGDLPWDRAARCLFRPAGLLTYADPLPQDLNEADDRITSARGLLQRNVREALPASLKLVNSESAWDPRLDLLASSADDTHFVVESESDGRIFLRFGNGRTHGRTPSDFHFTITYRLGNGRAGNVSAKKICRVVNGNEAETRVSVSNPLPACGGQDPEPAEEVRLFAPQAFRKQQRAINADDYAARAQSFSGVQRVNADFRWTGSWYTVYLFVDCKVGQTFDPDFQKGLRKHLDGYRLAGYDLEIREATYVPLRIVFTLEIKPGFVPKAVIDTLKIALGYGELSDGRCAYFHPDNWTFGKPVYLSHFYRAILNVPGVAALDVTTFERTDRPGTAARDQGVIEMARHEIVDSGIEIKPNHLEITIEKKV